ncbi:tRNA-dihydrouridine synthase A [Kluyvera cryocrescens]|uniref:tRNA-dihydrouridine synthase A n=1 Tax=Kluyvera cryocrescens TaxID=580 RepID=A0A485B5Q9_KLUCR|nr:tRNA-dihydrouridine synthase A [Kluyvera cryocrescens]
MSINGGIKSLEEAKAHLAHMDGVDGWARSLSESRVSWRRWTARSSGASDVDADPVAVVRAMYLTLKRELSNGTYLGHVNASYAGLCSRVSRGARQWRRYLSENAHKPAQVLTSLSMR